MGTINEDLTMAKKLKVLFLISQKRILKADLPEETKIGKSLCYYYIDKLIKKKLVREDEEGYLELTPEGEKLVGDLVGDLNTNTKTCLGMSVVLFILTVLFSVMSPTLSFAFGASSLSFLIAGVMFGSAHRKRLEIYGLEASQKS